MKPITVDELLNIVNNAFHYTGNTCKDCPLYSRCNGVSVCGTSIGVVARLVKDGYLTLATDTNLPRSAKRSVGEDINVPTTLPKWVKVGQWVEFSFARDDRPYKILREKHGEVYISNMADDERAVYYGECKPVRFRSYSFEEAKGLLGKTMERVNENGAKIIEIIVDVVDVKGVVYINECVFNFLQRTNATINGVPVGIPVVDEEAMKEVEE